MHTTDLVSSGTNVWTLDAASPGRWLQLRLAPCWFEFPAVGHAGRAIAVSGKCNKVSDGVTPRSTAMAGFRTFSPKLFLEHFVLANATDAVT